MPRKRSPVEVLAEAGTDDTREFVRRVRRATRRKFTPEEKVRVVLEEFRRDVPVSELWSSSQILWKFFQPSLVIRPLR